MKIKLTEDIKKYLEKLNDETKSKLIITEETVENKNDVKDEELIEILFNFYRERSHKNRAELLELNAQLQKEHPEYFESSTIGTN